jgi:G:T-mismatch repair DNA endonuclease (very short patch repair protein)
MAAGNRTADTTDGAKARKDSNMPAVTRRVDVHRGALLASEGFRVFIVVACKVDKKIALKEEGLVVN